MKRKTLIASVAALCFIPFAGIARELPVREPAPGFTHPGVLHTQEDFDRIARQLAEGNPTVTAAYQSLKSAQYAQSNAWSEPTEVIVRGGGTGENYMAACRACTIAYQNALRWKIEGSKACANNAVRILNAWAKTTKDIDGDSNFALASGLYGYQFANAAELMRDYPGWAEEDFTAFKQWLLDVWYPECLDFLTRRNDTWKNDRYSSRGQRPGHYWSNWGLCNAMTLMSIGIVCDDVLIYNQGVSFFKYDQVGNFSDKIGDYLTNRGCNEYLGNLVPAVYDDRRGPLGKLGQMQESGRDQGHALLAVGLAADLCQIAWNQGDDLFSYMDNRLAAGIEYVAAYNFGGVDDLPYTPYHYATCSTAWDKATVQSTISDNGRGGIRPIWGRIIAHYEGVKGIKMTYSEKALKAMGIDGGGTGGVSGGYDHPGCTVLTCTLDGGLASPEDVPTPLNGTITYNKQTVRRPELGGTLNNFAVIGTEIKAGQEITLMPSIADGSEDTGLWQWNTGQTTRQITITVHQSGVYRVTYTNAYGVKSQQVFTIASEDDGMSSIEYTTADNEIAEVEYYNLQGQRIAHPDNGIFIRRQGNKAEKVRL